MAAAPPEKIDLWALIVSCGLEEEFEHDWMGRVKHKRTRVVLRADVTPELVRTLAGANQMISDAQRGAAGAIETARQTIVSKLLTNSEKA
jgi:hypothetical protein